MLRGCLHLLGPPLVLLTQSVSQPSLGLSGSLNPVITELIFSHILHCCFCPLRSEENSPTHVYSTSLLEPLNCGLYDIFQSGSSQSDGPHYLHKLRAASSFLMALPPDVSIIQSASKQVSMPFLLHQQKWHPALCVLENCGYCDRQNVLHSHHSTISDNFTVPSPKTGGQSKNFMFYVLFLCFVFYALFWGGGMIIYIAL